MATPFRESFSVAHDVRLPDAVPVEARVKDGLHEVAVGEVVGPLALALEPGEDGVMAVGFLEKPLSAQVGVADHEVADDHGHLDAHGPGLVLAVAGMPHVGGVDVRAFLAVGLDPFEGPLEFGVGVDPLLEAAVDLAHVDGLVAHAEVVLEEVRVDDGAGDAHRDRADGE